MFVISSCIFLSLYKSSLEKNDNLLQGYKEKWPSWLKTNNIKRNDNIYYI